jgi:hypothetical protein
LLLDAGDGEQKYWFIRVEYDVAKTAKAIKTSDLPDEFAECLATGGRPIVTTADGG